MSDQQITCSECGGVFVFTEAEQQFYETKGLAAPPKRCKACRQARRAAREGGAGPDNARGGFGGGGFGGGAPRGRVDGAAGRPGAAPRRFSNDANEYRAPMNGGGDRGFGAPRGGAAGGNARGPRPARPGFGGPPQAGGFRGNGNAEGRPSFDRPDARARGSFEGSAPRPPRDQGEYRGPARDRGQWGTNGAGTPGQGAGASRGAAFGGNERPRRPERDFNAPRPERVAAPPSDDPRQTRPRAERPRFDITCAECGTQSQVPFKPLEGRQVFCQTCYRARKGTSTAEAGAVEATEAPEADLGIVE